VVYGPAGCGKTRNAEALRLHYGMDRVIDGADFEVKAYSGETMQLNGWLILVTAYQLPVEWAHVATLVVPFENAMKEIAK
jgi:hypothetical protein